jgi:hypothetical protein
VRYQVLVSHSLLAWSVERRRSGQPLRVRHNREGSQSGEHRI